MSFEKQLERVMRRRQFLAGLGLTVGSVAIAKLALLQTKAEELARQPDAPGVTGFGSGPGGARPSLADLPLPKIVRAGSQTVTIDALSTGGSAAVTLSPVLPGAVSDYLVFATADFQSAGPGSNFRVAAKLDSLSQLTVGVERAYVDIAASGQSPATHTHTTHATHTPATHSSVDVNTTNPHTHDSHTLTHAAHSAAGGHTHQTFVVNSTAAEEVATVAWMILQIV